MREVHFCETCDFRPPYCVRTDPRFCGHQCRLWEYRHRGIKRLDFPPGGDLDPARRKKGQPKTLAEAMAALASTHAELARLQAAARQQQTLENQLRNHLMEVTHALTESRSQSRKDLDALRDELDAEKKRATESTEREQAAAQQVKELREQADSANAALKQSEETAAAHKTTAKRREQDLNELRKERDQRIAQYTQELGEQKSKLSAGTAQHEKLQSEHAELRQKHTALQDSAFRAVFEQEARVQTARSEADELRKAQARDAERAASDLRTLTTQREELVKQRNALSRQNDEQIRRREELTSRLETVERTLSQRDDALKKQLQNFAAAERAHKEVHVVAESESRSLRAEKERRIAAEQRIEQLTCDLEQMARSSQFPSNPDTDAALIKMRDDLLAAELLEVRRHRDDAIAERELLAARILMLMAPGQYWRPGWKAGTVDARLCNYQSAWCGSSGMLHTSLSFEVLTGVTIATPSAVRSSLLRAAPL